MNSSRHSAFVLSAVLLTSGCSGLPHFLSLPEEIEVSAIDSEMSCATLPDALDVQLRVSNHGQGVFRTYIDNTPGPPYQLSWLSYVVLNATTKTDQVEWDHSPGGHGPLPQDELAIGPDDATIVYARIYGARRMDAQGLYRIQIKDGERRTHMSDEFNLCQPSTGPTTRSNSTFKPASPRNAA